MAWKDQLLNWTMKDPAFKTQLFRFINVLPMLRALDDIYQHLREYLLDSQVSLPPGLAAEPKPAGGNTCCTFSIRA